MTNYLVTLIGDFESDEICQGVVSAISPVIDSETVKVQRKTGVLLLYFASEMQLFEMHVALKILAKDLDYSFVLSEHTDKLSVFIPNDTELNFLNLSNNLESDLELIPKNGYQFIDEMYEEELVALLLTQVEQNTKAPKLDELLEKIKTDGIDSLTPFEKGVLESYSK